ATIRARATGQRRFADCKGEAIASLEAPPANVATMRIAGPCWQKNAEPLLGFRTSSQSYLRFAFRRWARLSTDIDQIAAGSFANLLLFRGLDKPAPLARAVDGD